MVEFLRLLFAISSHLPMLVIGIVTLYFNIVWFKEKTIYLGDFLRAVVVSAFFPCCFFFGMGFVVFRMNVAGGVE